MIMNHVAELFCNIWHTKVCQGLQGLFGARTITEGSHHH